MNSKMEQVIGNMCPTVSANSINRQNVNTCFDDQCVQVPQQQVQQPYYKYQSEMVENATVPEMPTAAHWWRESTEVFPNPHPQPQQGECEAEPPIVPHSSKELPAEIIKPKPGRKPKTDKEHKDSVNRTKHPEKWKVNVKKNARLKGEEYVGVGGKIVPAKVMGPVCDCRMRCGEKIDEESRRELHQGFWNTSTWIQRRQYIALLVKESAKQRSRVRAEVKSETRRQITFTYSLLLNGDFITVCKTMFLNTFSISEKLVRTAMDKKRTSPGGIIGPDQRGRHTKSKKSDAVQELVRDHIKSFPAEKVPGKKDHSGKKYLDASLNIAAMHKMYVKKCEEMGIPTNEIVKESYYRRIFKMEFKLGFKTEERNKSHISGCSNKSEKS